MTSYLSENEARSLQNGDVHLPWIRVSKVGLLISQLLLDGWVRGKETLAE